MAEQTLPTPPRSPVVATEEDPDIHPVPPYSVEDGDALDNRIAQAKDLGLPITQAPPNPPWLPIEWSSKPEDMTIRLQRDIVSGFFQAVREGNQDIVANFVARGFVSPDVATSGGERPLHVAVQTGSLPMVSQLVALGATVNAFATIDPPRFSNHGENVKQRTPLQLAAQEGNLAIVRALVEDYGADDALVAPDGELALRLAAKNGHRDIVAYLPARKGGAMLRLRSSWRRETNLIRAAAEAIYKVFKALLWELPKFFVYTLPRETWKERRKIISWCKRLPRRAKEVMVRIPEFTKRAGKRVITIAKKTPEIAKLFLSWLAQGLKAIGKSIGNITAKLLSFIHTSLAALVSFFRQITLQDAWRGICLLIRAIGQLPRTILSWAKKFGDVAYKVCKSFFGSLGCVLYVLGNILFQVVLFVPRKMGQIALALGRVSVKVWSELMIFCNPKRV